MPNLDELLKKDHVKNHPLFKQRKERIARQRENRKLRAQMFDSMKEDDENLTDMFSKGGDDEEENPSLPSLIRSAVVATEALLSQFNFPIYPKISYNNIKNIKYATHDPDVVVGGSILLNCQIKTLKGMNRLATISVPIDRSRIIPPAILELDGRLYTIGQASIDKIVERSTSYQTESLRGMYDPPLEGDERVMAVENKYDVGYIPRDSGDIFDVVKRSRKMSKVHGAYELVTDAMREADKAGEDSFPRQWSYLAQKYILPIVDSASPDVWMDQLINDGFCINPYGVNRGRPTTTASKKAQFDDEGFEGPFIIDLPGFEGKVFESYEDAYEALGSEYMEESRGQADKYSPAISDASSGEILDELSTFIREAKKAQVKDEEFDDEEEILDSMDVEPRLYPGTKTPIEPEDKVKFNGHEGPIRGKIVKVDPSDDYLIIESKGIRYQVHCDDIEVLPSTFSKMYK